MSRDSDQRIMTLTAETTYHSDHLAYVTVLRQNGKRVGHCQWARLESGDVKIASIFIEEEHRRRGYGSALMRLMAISFSKTKEVRRFYLDETLDGGRRNKFFQNFGFRYVSDDNEMMAMKSTFIRATKKRA